MKAAASTNSKSEKVWSLIETGEKEQVVQYAGRLYILATLSTRTGAQDGDGKLERGLELVLELELDVRTLLLDSYTAGEIEDEIIILYEAHTSKNPDFPYYKYGRFSLDDMNESECKAKFRVEKADLPRLAAALDIPGQFVCPHDL